jgi:aspartyl-tRNA(Asn)/glutamyl-tRNA(Gln) amidotransferase subunit B
MTDAARVALPELPAQRAQRLERELELSAESAQRLAFSSELGDYFETALAAGMALEPPAPAQMLANWITGDLVARLQDGEDPQASRVQPAALASLVGLIASRRVSVGAGRQVLDRLVAEGGEPQAIVEQEGLAAMEGEDELAAIVAEALRANADAAERVREGNTKAIGPIVGHVMRETKGRADGGEVSRLIHEQLGA